jgi:phage tail sheath gpL-like
MSASKHLLQITDPVGGTISPGTSKRHTIKALQNLIKGIAAGTRLGSATIDLRASLTAASGTLTASSASGTVGGVINGVTITVTAAGGDTNTAALIAAAINASTNALVQNVVTASSNGAVVTVTSVLGGVYGNTITLAASGTGMSASGARLTSGAETRSAITF